VIFEADTVMTSVAREKGAQYYSSGGKVVF